MESRCSATHFRCMREVVGTNFVQDLAGFGLAVVVPFEIFRKISENFSPAGVTSPFVARAMPTDATSVVPVSGR